LLPAVVVAPVEMTGEGKEDTSDPVTETVVENETAAENETVVATDSGADATGMLWPRRRVSRGEVA
jgi:hypothetical protein